MGGRGKGWQRRRLRGKTADGTVGGFLPTHPPNRVRRAILLTKTQQGDPIKPS